MATFIASLSCQHQRRFRSHPPDVGEVIWCPSCVDYKTVSIVLGPYRAQCSQCRSLNIAGNQESRVLRKASEHAEQYHHRVIAWETGRVNSRQVITAESRGQEYLPMPELEA